MVHFDPYDGLGLNLFLITYVSQDGIPSLSMSNDIILLTLVGFGVVALEKVVTGYRLARYEKTDESKKRRKKLGTIVFVYTAKKTVEFTM